VALPRGRLLQVPGGTGGDDFLDAVTLVKTSIRLVSPASRFAIRQGTPSSRRSAASEPAQATSWEAIASCLLQSAPTAQIARSKAPPMLPAINSSALAQNRRDARRKLVEKRRAERQPEFTIASHGLPSKKLPLR